MKRFVARRALPAALALLGAVPAARAQGAPAAERPGLLLELDPCVGSDRDEVRRIVAVELGSPAVGATGAGVTRAHVGCEGSLRLLAVDDGAARTSLRRTVDLRAAAPSVRGRLVALAVVELVAASRAERDEAPTPASPPVTALPSIVVPVLPAPTHPDAPPPRDPVTATPTTPLAPVPSGEGRATSPARASTVAPPAASVPAQPPAFSGLDGSEGLFHVATTGGSSGPGIRVGVTGAYATAANFLGVSSSLFPRPTAGVDHTTRGSVAAAVGVSPVRDLDVFATLRWDSSETDGYARQTIQGLTELGLGVTGSVQLARGFYLGATIALSFRAAAAGFDFNATGAAVRLQTTLDLSQWVTGLPLRVHANAGYMMDNSAAGVFALERARREATPGYDRAVCDRPPSSNPGDPRNNNPACQVEVDRFERFGWSIARADRLYAAIAIDAWFPGRPEVRPFIEYSAGLPLIRTAYVCWAGGGTGAQIDGCLASPGVSAGAAAASYLTLGVRVTLPGSTHDSATAALDVATGGSTVFVRELPPITPWTAYLGVAVAFDLGRRGR